MDALSILEKYAEQNGWDLELMLEKACNYIDNQSSSDAFEDFVATSCEQ